MVYTGEYTIMEKSSYQVACSSVFDLLAQKVQLKTLKTATLNDYRRSVVASVTSSQVAGAESLAIVCTSCREDQSQFSAFRLEYTSDSSSCTVDLQVHLQSWLSAFLPLIRQKAEQVAVSPPLPLVESGSPP